MRLRLLAMLALAGLAACGPSGPAVLEFVEISPAQPRLGEVVTVRFKLIDYRGVPLAGSRVNFKLQADKAGVTLSPTTFTSLRGSGFAETQVVATARVNSVIVVATAGDKSVSSPPITFAGTVPNGRQFTFQCGDLAGTGSGGRHAIGAFDQSRNLIAGVKIECSAHAGDRNGDGVEGALVSFLTEAGTIGPTETTSSDGVGSATITHKTSLPLPAEVTPDVFTWTPIVDATHTGQFLAPLWMEPYNWVENPLNPGVAPTLREPRRPDPIRLKPDGTGRYENNPRDNLVTMIAVTAGEEGFTDSNNNGVHDQGEDFDDLTEPFVDSNDNGTWDPDERFIDLNGDKIWNGKNDRWDPNTLIWTEEKILWTGIPADQDMTPVPMPVVPGHRPVFLPVQPNRIDLRCPGTGGLCSQAGDPMNGYLPVDVTTFVADPWFNSLAQNGDSDGCAVREEDDSPVAVKYGAAAGTVFTYPAGRYLRFAIADKRDPLAAPMDSTPRRTPAIGFKATIFCSFTASPIDSYTVQIMAGSVTGTIE